jgi:hypothetical protein
VRKFSVLKKKKLSFNESGLIKGELPQGPKLRIEGTMHGSKEKEAVL